MISVGQYEVFARWVSNSSCATDAKYTVYHAGGSSIITVNQELNGGDWVSLGTYSFNVGNNTRVILSDDADQYVVADAVKLELVP